MESGSAELTGLKRTDPSFEWDVLCVLQACHDKPVSIQGDYARGHAQSLCAAASMGLISTAGERGYGRNWRVTVEGLQALMAGGL